MAAAKKTPPKRNYPPMKPTKSEPGTPVSGKQKWSVAYDHAFDKAHGIVEGSKQDIRLDHQHGVIDNDQTAAARSAHRKRGM